MINEVKQVRQAYKMTQEEFARALKVGTSTIRVWESPITQSDSVLVNIELRIEAFKRSQPQQPSKG